LKWIDEEAAFIWCVSWKQRILLLN
jgi:hypothetical protein